MRFWIVMAAAFSLIGCAGQPSKPVGGPIKGSPSVSEALANPAQFTGARVRWGGVIAGVENLSDSTQIVVVGRDLEESGKPKSEERSLGRFIARIHGFLDPEVYARGRLFTVSGTISGFETQNVGQFPYRYPVVDVERYHLWKREPVVVGYPDHYYGPYWGPGYPYYYSPYYYPWHYGPYWPYW